MILPKLITILLFLATVLGLYNVYGAHADVQQMAERTACGEKGCVRMLRSHRTPMAHNFEFQVSVQPAKAIEIRCARAYMLLGSFACEGVPH
ncbi:MAG: hypothetical protein RL685_7743 [Pseudomonadota bacterium]